MFIIMVRVSLFIRLHVIADVCYRLCVQLHAHEPTCDPSNAACQHIQKHTYGTRQKGRRYKGAVDSATVIIIRM